MSDTKRARRGDLGTFIIRVQQKENSTWQGRVTWSEEDKTMNFRAILELIKLIESGIAASCPDQERDADPSWED